MEIQVVKSLTDVKERSGNEEGVRGAAPVENHRESPLCSESDPGSLDQV